MLHALDAAFSFADGDDLEGFDAALSAAVEDFGDGLGFGCSFEERTVGDFVHHIVSVLRPIIEAKCRRECRDDDIASGIIEVFELAFELGAEPWGEPSFVGLVAFNIFGWLLHSD